MCHERVVFPGLPKAVVLFFHLRQLMFNKVRLSLGDIAGNLLQMTHIVFGIEGIHAYFKGDALFTAHFFGENGECRYQ